jgi:hypothetical protein
LPNLLHCHTPWRGSSPTWIRRPSTIRIRTLTIRTTPSHRTPGPKHYDGRHPPVLPSQNPSTPSPIGTSRGAHSSEWPTAASAFAWQRSSVRDGPRGSDFNEVDAAAGRVRDSAVAARWFCAEWAAGAPTHEHDSSVPTNAWPTPRPLHRRHDAPGNESHVGPPRRGAQIVVIALGFHPTSSPGEDSVKGSTTTCPEQVLHGSRKDKWPS